MATQIKDEMKPTFTFTPLEVGRMGRPSRLRRAVLMGLSPFPIFQKMFRSLSHFHTFSLSRFHTRNGFTFIELVIVILLIGILVAAIGPRILHLQDSFKVEAAAEQIANHIRLAQSLAIAKHETHGVGFDPDPNNLYSVYDQDGDAVTDPLRGGSFSLWGIDFDSDAQLKGVDIESPTTLTGDQVDFDALGKPTSGGSVTISKGSTTLNIGVAAETGAISIW